MNPKYKYADGKSALYHGDCIEVMEYIQSESVNLIVTSPPYADIKEYDTTNGVAPDLYPDWFVNVARAMERVLKPDGSIIVVIDSLYRDGFLSPYVLKTAIAVLENTGLKLAQRHFWLKPNARPDNTGRLKNAIEDIFHFVRQKDYYTNKDAVRIESEYASIDKRAWKYNPGGADPTNVIMVKKTQNQKTIHPALYPDALPDRFIPYLSRVGDTVLDPFVGSGTTVRRAMELMRIGIGIDLSEKYLDISHKSIVKLPKIT